MDPIRKISCLFNIISLEFSENIGVLTFKCFYSLYMISKKDIKHSLNLSSSRTILKFIDNLCIYMYIYSIPLFAGYINNLKVLYSSRKASTSQKTSIRHIPQQPDRILDAPDLLDDYCKTLTASLILLNN